MANAAETPKSRKKSAAHDHDHDARARSRPRARPRPRRRAQGGEEGGQERRRRGQGARAARRGGPQRSLPVRLGKEIQEVPPRRRRAGDDRAARGARRQGAADERLAAVRAAAARAPPRRSSAPRSPSTRACRTRTSASAWPACRPATPTAPRRSCRRVLASGEGEMKKLRAKGTKDAFSQAEYQPYIRAAHALGCLAYDEERYADAVTDLERVHAVDDGSVGIEARLISAKALMKLEKPADAVALLEPATKLEGGAGRANLGLALAHFAAGAEAPARRRRWTRRWRPTPTTARRCSAASAAASTTSRARSRDRSRRRCSTRRPTATCGPTPRRSSWRRPSTKSRRRRRPRRPKAAEAAPASTARDRCRRRLALSPALSRKREREIRSGPLAPRSGGEG